MAKIKGWTKTREDKQYIVWQNDTTRLNLIVAGNELGWHHSAAVNQSYAKRSDARKAAVRFMKGRPNG